MSWRREAMKDVVVCDKPRGTVKRVMIRGSPNGETHPDYVGIFNDEFIVVGSQRGELKHLSTHRKGNQPRLRK